MDRRNEVVIRHSDTAQVSRGRRCLIQWLTVLLIAIAAQPVALHAQTEMEYKMEIGVMGGTSFYMGDADNSGMYRNLCGSGGIIARYNLNPRMAFKFNLTYSGIKGDGSAIANQYQQYTADQLRFSRGVIDLGCQYEINFWAYGTGKSYKNTKRLVPYLQMGLGLATANKAVGLVIPLGFGIRYKLLDRLNIGLDWAVRFSTSDKFDGIENPYRIKSGFLKNKDTYCNTMLYITYDFFPKLRKCNN